MNYNPIIIALDVETAADARALVKRIGERVGFYTVSYTHLDVYKRQVLHRASRSVRLQPVRYPAGGKVGVAA